MNNLNIEKLKEFSGINNEIYGQIEALHTLSKMYENFMEVYILDNGNETHPYIVVKFVHYGSIVGGIQYTARLNFSNNNAEVRISELAKTKQIFKTTIKEALDNISQYY